MERRLGWSRALCSTVLVLGIVIASPSSCWCAQAVSDAVRGFTYDLPEIVDHVRHSDVGDFINGGSGSLDALRARDRHNQGGGHGLGRRRRCRRVGLRGGHCSSVIFLTLFGLNDEPRVRDWIGGLMYRDARGSATWMSRTGSSTTSRYMLGNLAISVICATVYGVTAVILDLAVPLALADRGVPRPHPDSRRSPVIIGRRAVGRPRTGRRDRAGVYSRSRTTFCSRRSSGGRPACRLHRARQRAVVRALFGFIGAIIGVPIAAGLQILVGELTAARRARIAAADLAEQQQPA